jgi:molybdopterin/thiamine biosynthesis adenylyltransferase
MDPSTSVAFKHLTRQIDLIPMQSLTQKVTIIGAGAIGSWVALALAKMGMMEIEVWDDDTVTVENMNCQFYRFCDIGEKKADSIKRMVRDFTGVTINSKAERYEGQRLSGVVISAVDSMAVRKLIWDSNKDNGMVKFIVDPRMGAETALLYCMDPCDEKDIESYEKTLFSDDDSVQERCTAKSTIYTANMLSGLVAKTVKDLITNGKYPRTTQWYIDKNVFNSWSKQ